MRHGDKIKNLSRTYAHRKALMSNLACQLFQHKRITTTLAKAKSLRIYAEPLVTRCKEDNTHNRRIIFSYLQDKEAIKELFGVISDKVADRPGGYTRIIKLPRRMGDASDMAMIELVDFNEIYGKETEEQLAKKTRRSRRGGKGGAKKSDTAPVATDTVAQHDEETIPHHEDVVTEEVIAHHEEPIAEVTTHHEEPVAEVTTDTPVATEETKEEITTTEEPTA